MHRCSSHNTTIFVSIPKVSSTCFGHFSFGHHQVGYNFQTAVDGILQNSGSQSGPYGPQGATGEWWRISNFWVGHQNL